MDEVSPLENQGHGYSLASFDLFMVFLFLFEFVGWVMRTWTLDIVGRT